MRAGACLLLGPGQPRPLSQQDRRGLASMHQAPSPIQAVYQFEGRLLVDSEPAYA